MAVADGPTTISWFYACLTNMNPGAPQEGNGNNGWVWFTTGTGSTANPHNVFMKDLLSVSDGPALDALLKKQVPTAPGNKTAVTNTCAGGADPTTCVTLQKLVSPFNADTASQAIWSGVIAVLRDAYGTDRSNSEGGGGSFHDGVDPSTCWY